jgi:hypothetical protein
MWIGFGGDHALKYEAGTSGARIGTEDDCVHALREAAQLLGDSPTRVQYGNLGLTPAASTAVAGTPKCAQTAGRTTRNRAGWTCGATRLIALSELRNP